MLILADDYTGAADAAVGLAGHGFSASIRLNPHESQAGANVVALDLDTRRRSPDEAEALVCAAIANAGAQEIVFKKIDSTLRGHIGAELRALTKISEDRPAPMILAPAVPENGRVVIDGCVLVRGVPLEDTAVWRHDQATSSPDLPARASERLAKAGLRVAEVQLSRVRLGVSTLKAQLLGFKAAGVEVVILDSETPDDLAIVAKTAASFQPMPICVGAAGLTRALGPLLHARSDFKLPQRTSPSIPVLLAIASQSKTARAQIEFLRNRTDLTTIETTSSVDLCAEQTAAALAAGNHVLLYTPLATQERLNRDRATTMGRIVARVADCAGALIVSGGDTARACLETLGYTRIEVDGELAPGVVLSHPGDRPELALVSKAGDFGEADTLSNCINQLAAP